MSWAGFPRTFLTVLIPIDPSSVENGCTEVFSLLFVITPLFLLLVHSAPSADLDGDQKSEASSDSDFTLSEACRTSAFWAFALATSLYGLVQSGISLFQESLLFERGFPKDTLYRLQIMTMPIGLASNLLTGWLATRIKIPHLAAVSMALLAGALLGLPYVSTRTSLIIYAVAMGSAGGMVTVLFFTVWAKMYGRAHLGRIQSVAQMLTVIGSAEGPRILAVVHARTNSYVPALNFLGAVAAMLAVAIALIPLPTRNSIPDSDRHREELATT